MRNMKDKISDFTEKFADVIGEVSIKISDKACEKCFILGIYEPNVPIEILKENTKK